MRPATESGLRAEPWGRFTSGPTWIHFAYAPGLWGVVLWGRPRDEDMSRLVASLARELDAGVPPHASLVDTRRVEGSDADAFRALGAYVAERERDLSRQVTRLSLVRPGGWVGALIAGFFEVLPKPYPVKIDVDVAAGLSWLAGDPPLFDPETVARELDAAHRSVAGTPDVVLRLRAWIDPRVAGELRIGDAARALGLSERTLQRRLGAASTSLTDEIALARVRVGKRLMIETDRALTTIALDVGCASLQHFGQLFRRLESTSPSEWRKARRAG
jgi:AraC-like DNA-binding protein